MNEKIEACVKKCLSEIGHVDGNWKSLVIRDAIIGQNGDANWIKLVKAVVSCVDCTFLVEEDIDGLQADGSTFQRLIDVVADRCA